MSESVHEPGELATVAPLSRVIDGIGRTRALDALGRAVSPLARRLSASPAGPLLRGDGVGHPLHPALTDLPIGFWTSAWCLDLIGGRGARRASQRLIALGVLSAVPTAAAGAVDLEQRPDRADRRVGMAHAAANSAALVCYSASWAARRRGRHPTGVALGMVGAAAATIGGFLGGHLAFGARPDDGPDAAGAPTLTGLHPFG